MKNNILEFISFSEKLKKMERFKGQFYWKDYPTLPRYESVADHSWRLSLLIYSFEKKLSQPINMEKALKMAIIHDLPETIAGDDSPMGKDGTGKDTHAYNESVQKQRHKNEKEAAKELFSKLPKDIGEEMFNLWVEYESQECFEAKVVKALDKLECLLQVLEYSKGILFKNHLEFNISYGLKHADVDPAIKIFGEEIAQKMRDSYKEYIKEQ